MKDPVRLINRPGLASSLLRAGSEERPSSAHMRRAVTALGTAAALGALTGEAAGGGATGLASGAAAGASVAKASGASFSLLLAAKWAGFGSVGAVLLLGGAELRSRAIPTARAPSATHVVQASNAPLTVSPSAVSIEAAHQPANVEPSDAIVAAGKRDENAALSTTTVHEGLARADNEATMRASNLAAERNVREKARARTPRPSWGEDSLPGARRDLPTDAPLALPSSAPVSAGNDDPSSEGARSAAAEAVAQAPKNDAPAAVTLRLTKEVRLVDSAWNAVKLRDFARALTLLSEYERQFPELGLHPEVLFVRMEAEDRLGHAAAARHDASRVVALYPKSVQADRARALLNRN